MVAFAGQILPALLQVRYHLAPLLDIVFMRLPALQVHARQVVDHIFRLNRLEIVQISSAPRLVLRFDELIRETSGRTRGAGAQGWECCRKECQSQESTSHIGSRE